MFAIFLRSILLNTIFFKSSLSKANIKTDFSFGLFSHENLIPHEVVVACFKANKSWIFSIKIYSNLGKYKVRNIHGCLLCARHHLGCQGPRVNKMWAVLSSQMSFREETNAAETCPPPSLQYMLLKGLLFRNISQIQTLACSLSSRSPQSLS